MGGSDAGLSRRDNQEEAVSGLVSVIVGCVVCDPPFPPAGVRVGGVGVGMGVV